MIIFWMKKKLDIKIVSTKNSLKNIQALNYEKDNQIVILNNKKIMYYRTKIKFWKMKNKI